MEKFKDRISEFKPKTNMKDYTADDLILLFREARHSKDTKCYFDIGWEVLKWTMEISDNKRAYYYGPTIWKYRNSLAYIGFIFQDKMVSNQGLSRETIIYHKIPNETYDELYDIWVNLNKKEFPLPETGSSPLPAHYNELLTNKINSKMHRKNG